MPILQREVLDRYEKRWIGLDGFAVTLEGEDDEIVMDLDLRLAAFYAELEALQKDQEASPETPEA